MSNIRPRRAIQPLSRIPDRRRNAQLRKWAAALRHTFALLLRYGPVHLRFWYALRLASRSLVGHTKTLLDKKRWAVDFGPLFERLPCGCLVPDERTDARSIGIQEIESRYPWASIVELQVFLEGFDAGERYGLRTSGKSAQVNAESSSASHSERCILRAHKQIPVDMLKRQWYKSQYESPRHRNPSQSY